jgi:hypothetical protein
MADDETKQETRHSTAEAEDGDEDKEDVAGHSSSFQRKDDDSSTESSEEGKAAPQSNSF